MKLSTPKSAWKKLFFMGNTSKMRKALMNYLSEEGLKNEFSEGVVCFEFESMIYRAWFETSNNWAECTISFLAGDEDYESLDFTDKTFIGDKMNTIEENHTTTAAFNDSVSIKTSFYFTNKRVMLNLFAQHLNEMSETVNDFWHLMGQTIDEKKEADQPKPIGCLGNKAIAAKEQ